jgi:HSP20 family protein
MAQNETQGMEAAAPQGGTGSQGVTEGSATPASTPGAGSQGKSAVGQQQQQQRKSETGTGSAATGREQGDRIARRETREDTLSNFFGGGPFFGGASPFAIFRLLSDDMERLFLGSRGQGQGHLGTSAGRFLPTIDVDERDDKILVRADLPGLKEDDFRVEIEDDALVIQGERRDEREDVRGGIRRAERSYGSFRRVIPLPQGANVEEADARFENGVLEIQIPLEQQSRSRRLEVKSGTGSGSTPSDPTRH